MKKNNTLSRFLKTSFLLMAVGILVSCQKEINPLEEENNNEPGQEVPANDSYMPFTKGSTWTYKDSANPALINILRASDEKKTVGGITFNKYEAIQGATDGDIYYAQQKNDYYMLLKSFSTTGGQIEITMLFLNDKEPVGYRWTKDAGSAGGTPARIKGLIEEKGITRSWEGKTYKDIIHSVVELEYNLLGTWVSMGVYHFYCAKGIGMVKNHNEISFEGEILFSNASYLIDYTIK